MAYISFNILWGHMIIINTYLCHILHYAWMWQVHYELWQGHSLLQSLLFDFVYCNLYFIINILCWRGKLTWPNQDDWMNLTELMFYYIADHLFHPLKKGTNHSIPLTLLSISLSIGNIAPKLLKFQHVNDRKLIYSATTKSTECSLFQTLRELSVNRKNLWALTLVGPTGVNPVPDPLALLHFNNLLYIFWMTQFSSLVSI